MLAKMLALTAERHINQYDKGGLPYFMHCYTVMTLLGETDDIELKCIALGHDLIEDFKYTKVTYQLLRDMGFSERVIEGIRCLSKMNGQTPEEYKALVMSNTDAMLVKMADLTHNSDIRRIKDAGENDYARNAKYRQFFTEIKEALKGKCVKM